MDLAKAAIVLAIRQESLVAAMNSRSFAWLLVTVLGLGDHLARAAEPNAVDREPVRVIFDTDITGDVDDVLALAMLHSLEDRGECDLLAVTISKVNPLTGPFTDAVNTFYGRPDMPLGITRDAQRRESKYLKLVETRGPEGLRYPHDVADNEQTPEPVALMRQILSSQPDQSVVIIQVGLAVNVARLLASPPDDISPMNGVELVRKKLKLLSVMAGAFEPIRGNTHYLEANVINDVPSMRQLAENWPRETPVVWSGFEIGIAAAYPHQSIARDFGYVPHHIVRESYLLHSGPTHNRPTWDLTSVLYAVRPDRGYFGLSQRGTVRVEEDGFTTFTPDENGRDRFLTMSQTQSARVREALVWLTSQPPRSSEQPSQAR